MTVSTADIPVLHSAKVAHLYPQVVLPICQGLAEREIGSNLFLNKFGG
jgi:hypothetical protein